MTKQDLLNQLENFPDNLPVVLPDGTNITGVVGTFDPSKVRYEERVVTVTKGNEKIDKNVTFMSSKVTGIMLLLEEDNDDDVIIGVNE